MGFQHSARPRICTDFIICLDQTHRNSRKYKLLNYRTGGAPMETNGNSGALPRKTDQNNTHLD
jgi:hypothetical protein